MARNKVQFQKGLSEAQFAVLYGTPQLKPLMTKLFDDRDTTMTTVEQVRAFAKGGTARIQR